MASQVILMMTVLVKRLVQVIVLINYVLIFILWMIGIVVMLITIVLNGIEFVVFVVFFMVICMVFSMQVVMGQVMLFEVSIVLIRREESIKVITRGIFFVVLVNIVIAWNLPQS